MKQFNWSWNDRINFYFNKYMHYKLVWSSVHVASILFMLGYFILCLPLVGSQFGIDSLGRFSNGIFIAYNTFALNDTQFTTWFIAMFIGIIPCKLAYVFYLLSSNYLSGYYYRGGGVWSVERVKRAPSRATIESQIRTNLSKL